jgi:hypothetical protein
MDSCETRDKRKTSQLWPLFDYPPQGWWPRLQIGQYYVTKPKPTKIRCKAYDGPPPNGTLLSTFEPGDLIGPVEEYAYSQWFATIRVGDSWINVWCAQRKGAEWGTNYAYLCGNYSEVKWFERSSSSNDEVELSASYSCGPSASHSHEPCFLPTGWSREDEDKHKRSPRSPRWIPCRFEVDPSWYKMPEEKKKEMKKQVASLRELHDCLKKSNPPPSKPILNEEEKKKLRSLRVHL